VIFDVQVLFLLCAILSSCQFNERDLRIKLLASQGNCKIDE